LPSIDGERPGYLNPPAGSGFGCVLRGAKGSNPGLTMAERPEFRPAGLRAAATRISHGLSE